MLGVNGSHIVTGMKSVRLPPTSLDEDEPFLSCRDLEHLLSLVLPVISGAEAQHSCALFFS
jgi:hypothetical protein